MAKVLFVRMAGGLGVVALATFIVGLVPFLSADPSAGAGFAGSPATPAYTVNHEFKGDRLPLPSDTNSAVTRTDFGLRQDARSPADIPVGCDPAFSPVSAPRLAYFYGRCVT
jgi:hypothetical protein